LRNFSLKTAPKKGIFGMISGMKKLEPILVCVKQNDPQAQKAEKELKKWLEKNGREALDVTNIKGEIPSSTLEKALFAVVIGGDGTFLSLVRRMEQKDTLPVMGVNLGSLGFITDIGKEQMLEAVGQALKGKFSTEDRPLLQVELLRKKGKAEATTVFNDVCLSKGAGTAMLKFEVSLDGELLSHVRADGYLVATPTGSTAYSLSAGGPLMHPQVQGLVLIPICAHSLSARPVVIPLEQKVEIKMQEPKEKAYLVCDGQVSFEVANGDKVRVRLASQKLKLLRPPGHGWSEALRSKLKMA
jgi:NAD+ kinase